MFPRTTVQYKQLDYLFFIYYLAYRLLTCLFGRSRPLRGTCMSVMIVSLATRILHFIPTVRKQFRALIAPIWTCPLGLRCPLVEVVCLPGRRSTASLHPSGNCSTGSFLLAISMSWYAPSWAGAL